MATEYYSTEASVKALIGNTRLLNWADFDDNDAADPETLTANFRDARRLIRDMLVKTYGDTIIATWDSDTAPDTIKSISDRLSVRGLYVGNPAFEGSEAAQEMYDTAMAELRAIADSSDPMAIYGVDAPVTDQIQTERTKSDFDPERKYNNQSVNPYWVSPRDHRDLPDYPE
jgi:hypothetical protein